MLNTTLLKYYWFRAMNPVLNCALCKLPTSKLICNTCYSELEIITNKQCQHCGKPALDTPCYSCLQNKPVIDRVYSKFIYATPLNKLLHKLKYRQNQSTMWVLGYLLNICLHEALNNSNIDFIIPVPLSNQRLNERGFNQIILMLKYYQAQNNSVPIKTNIVKKIIDTPHQTLVNKNQRIDLVDTTYNQEVFRVVKNVMGKNILIVDDVITTGATANKLAQVLKAAGANQVKLCTLMRTL